MSQTDIPVEDRHGVGEIYDTIPQLVDRMQDVETVEEWSWILQDHVSFGNDKLPSNIAIFNMGTATGCVNNGTEYCQVTRDGGRCYATKPEDKYPGTALYRERQGFVWDSLDPETFARAFLKVVDRKRNPVDFLRFNEAGDFRVNGDIVRVNEIAKTLKEAADIRVYAYSASSYLNWSLATDFTVLASNDRFDAADARFRVVDDESDIPDGAYVCPQNCSECRACMFPGGGDEIYVTYH